MNVRIRRRRRIKLHSDGRALLNLGCGARTHPGWTNVDFSIYARLAPLARWRRVAALTRQARLLSAERYERLRSLDPDTIHWDLRRGVPFPDASFDAVYHSHFLEHLEREAAEELLKECWRVLRTGGVLRVVVPDFGHLSRRYLETYAEVERGQDDPADALRRHEDAMHDVFGQMVVREFTGRAGEQHPLVRRMERLARGDAARVGELHRWMYDRHTLAALLERLGFDAVKEEGAASGRIVGWAEFHLDTEPDGSAYKPESLYMEGVRPAGPSAETRSLTGR